MLFVFSTTIAWATGGGEDAGIIDIAIPGNTCAGSQDITVLVQNYGTVAITSVTIEWAVNSISQPTYFYTGNILPGDWDTVVIGTYNFIGGTNNTIEAFTVDPNGVSDNNPSNDYLSILNGVMLNGAYTVGGTSPDYARFTDAVNALVNFGVCGPVTFNIRPGIDTLQAIIPEILGADALNRITFQAENGDSSSVKFTYPSQPAFNPTNYLIRLSGADYITFNKLTLECSGVNPYGRVIEYMQVATENFITNCHLIGTTANIVNSLGALVYSSSSTTSNDSNNAFIGNRFEGGSLGLYMNGVSAQNLELNLVANDNVFINQYSKAIQLSNQGVISIRNNSISTNSSYVGYVAIYLDRCQRNQVITKNKINSVPGTGLYLVDCTGLAGIRAVISNNFIQCSDSAGISIINSDYQDIVNNSVNMTGTLASSSALFIRGSGTFLNVINNVLVNSGGGYAYVISDSAIFAVQTSDRNDIYTTGSVLGSYNGVNRATLANWQTASSRDINSLGVDPLFATVTDLHATSIAMDNAGVQYSTVPDDIDGEFRSATTPDIGADEYTGTYRDVTLSAILFPSVTVCEDTSALVQVNISNTGGIDEVGLDISATITGPNNYSLTESVNTIAAGATMTVTFSTPVDLVAGSYSIVAIVHSAIDANRTNDTLTSTFDVISSPALPVATDTARCGNGSVELTAATPVNDTAYWYDSPMGGTLLFVGNTFATPSLSNTTTYYVQTGNYCPTQVRVTSIATINDLPVINLGPDLTVFNPIVLDAGSGFASYLWSTTDTTQLLNVTFTDTYFVTVSDANGCANSDTIFVDVITSINDLTTAVLKLYPNPATTYLNIEQVNGTESTLVELHGADGRLVLTEKLSSGVDKKTLDVSALAKGIYTVKIANDKSGKTYRVVIN